MNKPLFPEVVVNGTPISSLAISAEAQNHPAPKGKPGVAWKSAARALVLRQLLLDEASRQGLTPDPAEVAPGKFETPEEALIRAVTENGISVAAPTEAEIREVWAQDPDRYVSPPLWEVSHILCAGDDGESRAALIAADVARNPRAFTSLAREVSDCPSGAQGGTLGQLRPGDTVPEFEVALRNLAEGEATTTPVKTRFGWHVIRMDGLAPGKVLPFEIVAPKLAEAMEKARWTVAAKEFTAQLIAAAEISGLDLTEPAAA
ncbi:peptidylprolyl isomerase [Pararhodobacter sp.]|uniref:peptidylprolyl isomerase n=1 Tax=Pararhodobacter sp. TaxID=2127056 RepID=UPI002AFE3C0B|nr:peptidylprolyl isomerase [Pararhodobacter sp.]